MWRKDTIVAHRTRITHYRNHVSIALGSCGELDTQMEIPLRLGYLPHSDLLATNDKLDRVGRMLRRLQQSLEKE
jgi:four helix bundle protein